MAGILVIAEAAGTCVTRESLETVSLAMRLAAAMQQPVCGAVLGAGDLANAAAQFQCGFSALLLVESPQLATYMAQQYVAAVQALIAKVQPTVVLFPHTAKSRDWAPRLAAKIGSGLVLDCVNVTVEQEGLTASKPMYGGGVLAKLVVHGDPALVSVRAGIFECAQLSSGGAVERMELPQLAAHPGIQHLESISIEGAGGQRLKDAKTIISGGRGIGKKSNWHFIVEAAAALGAAVGCSRPVADAGWVSSSSQVGLSGALVAPDIYIAVGISGAVQHLAGISSAKTVIAINNDPEADIFKRADYGVVDDFREVLPAFVERIKQLRS